MSYKVAVASTDGRVVNQHFGRADTFYIIEVFDTQNYKLVEIRETESVCQSGNHDELELKEKVLQIADCTYVLVSRIGLGAENVLNQQGITAFTIPDFINEAVTKMIAHIEIDELIKSFVKDA